MAKTVSFQIPTTSKFTYHPIIRRYMVLVAEKKGREMNQGTNRYNV